MLDKEIMPLVTHRNYDKEDGHYISTTVGTAEDQRDADLKVLEAKVAWLENAWRNYLGAKEKEAHDAGFTQGYAQQLIDHPSMGMCEVETMKKEWAAKEATVLIRAKETIKVWYELMGNKDWEFYDKASPEMKLINSTIAELEGK